jgi:hypothetical protein
VKINQAGLEKEARSGDAPPPSAPAPTPTRRR